MNPSSDSPKQGWHSGSWRALPARQQPNYDDEAALARTLDTLRTKPPLVSTGEVDRLASELAEAAEGKRFVLHGGDCAERFADCTSESLTARLQVLLQMSLVLTHATRRPVVRIGRMAGQYAKPRTSDAERVDGRELPVYRGDLINDNAPDAAARRADPGRMLDGYHHAAASLNYVRALIEGGFADLHHPERWDLSFIETSPHREAYRAAVDAIVDAIAFMEAVGTHHLETLSRVEFYTSHEALLLSYEEALTRAANGGAYNLGAHFLWLGYRTSHPCEAHVEYLSGVDNPVGVKIGAKTKDDDLLAVLDRLDPRRVPGRVTLITRLGAGGVALHLPRLVGAVARTGRRVVWSCDPMHGNTEVLPGGRKTRRMEHVLTELEATHATHARLGSAMSGVHFELTGEPVTECIGGPGGVLEEHLSQRYDTACDPRLNGAQALEMAFLLARLLR